jgi:glycosyltransferase involved in cell wall biosynthesis
MPSKGDAFGIVFLEAYFNRLPVIALQIGAAPDVIQHGSTGFMVPPGDIQELANTLIDLIGDPHRCKQFGDKGFSENYPRYTWKNVGTLIKTRIEMEIM